MAAALTTYGHGTGGAQGISPAVLYVPFRWLLSKGLSADTVRNWDKRGADVLKTRNETYINYYDIPQPTRRRLPDSATIQSEISYSRAQSALQDYHAALMEAYNAGYGAYTDIYERAGAQMTDFARRHAVFAAILDMRGECRRERRRFDSRGVYDAFRRIYPDMYSYYRFVHVLARAEKTGVESVITRGYRHGNTLYDSRHRAFVLEALSSPKRYTQKQVSTFVKQACGLEGLRVPSLSWVKGECRRLASVVSVKRNGGKARYNDRPYMGLVQAGNVHTQWQIDGWRLPFYMKGFKTLVIFNVLDAHSGKIVGSFVSERENSETILKGLENAVVSTGVIPAEIVSDNHTFNRTQEAEWLKKGLAAWGCTWTVTSNPRQKSLVERHFRTFGDNFCKLEYGYTGQGVLTKMKNGRPSQEYIDKCLQKPLTREQITLIAGRCVSAYNATAQDKDGKSPDERYAAALADASRERKFREIPFTEALKLFFRRSKATMRRGQITIERGGVKYEYQANAAQFHDLNNKRFAVRYINFDKIMLYDMKTDAFICTLERKRYAHAALADRTQDDARLYHMHAGRLKGIEAEAARRMDAIMSDAESTDPEAAFVMNPLLTPKEDFEEYRRFADMSAFADRHGINVADVMNIPAFCEGAGRGEKRDAREERPFARAEKVDLAMLDN